MATKESTRPENLTKKAESDWTRIAEIPHWTSLLQHQSVYIAISPDSQSQKPVHLAPSMSLHANFCFAMLEIHRRILLWQIDRWVDVTRISVERFLWLRGGDRRNPWRFTLLNKCVTPWLGQMVTVALREPLPSSQLSEHPFLPYPFE